MGSPELSLFTAAVQQRSGARFRPVQSLIRVSSEALDPQLNLGSCWEDFKA